DQVNILRHHVGHVVEDIRLEVVRLGRREDERWNERQQMHSDVMRESVRKQERVLRREAAAGMVGPMVFRMADEGGGGVQFDVAFRELTLESHVRSVGLMILAVEEPLLESEGFRELELLSLHALLAPDGRGPA